MVYEPAQTTDFPIDLNYASVRREKPITIDMRTRVSRAHAVNCVAEIRRIIYTVRKGITDWNSVRYESNTWVNNYANFWQNAAEIRLLDHVNDVTG